MKAEVTYRMSGPTELRVDGQVVARCSPANRERYAAFVEVARGLNALDREPNDGNNPSNHHGSPSLDSVCSYCRGEKTALDDQYRSDICDHCLGTGKEPVRSSVLGSAK